MKRCAGCEELKPVASFYKDRQKKDGLTSRCKPCKDGQNRCAFERDPSSSRRAKRKWAKANPERMRALKDAWDLANPAKVKASFAKWARANRVKIVAWREAHRSVFREASRAWARRHPEMVLATSRRRRARIAGSAARITAEEWVSRVAEFDGRCAYCLAPAERPTFDHFRPLVLGGEHDEANAIPACGRCNSSKHDGLVFDWVPRGVGVCLPLTSRSGSRVHNSPPTNL